MPPVPAPPTWADLARDWLGETWRAVRSDLAVHGLAYLGVLLLFAGVFGLVAFSFGELSNTLRPTSEVAIPASIFLAAWFLRRRGAPYVADALVLLGGAVLPIVCFASLVDGSDVPEDLTGGALEAALAAVAAVLSGLYAWITLRRPATMLRFLVAPVAWLGVMMATLATDPELRGGEEITRPGPWQTAATLLAILATALVARRLRGRTLADATSSVVLPGATVVLALQVLASAREGWPIAPSIVAGLTAIAVVEVEHRRLPDVVTVVLQGLLLAGTLAMLGPRLDPAWLGAAGVATFLLLAEWEGLRRGTCRAVGLLLVPAAAGLAISLPGTWSIVVAFTAASAWAQARRLRHADWVPQPDWLVTAAALLPAGVAAGLLRALDPVTATAIVVGVLLALAIAARTPPLRRDPFWSWWTPAAATVALALVAVVARDGEGDSGDLGRLAGSAAAVGVVFALSRAPAALRVWATALAWCLAAGLGFAAADADVGMAAIVAAGVGLVLVVVALARRIPVAGDLGLVGHMLTLGAVVPAAVAEGGPLVVALGAMAAGWILTTAAEETVGSEAVTRLAGYESAAARFLDLEGPHRPDHVRLSRWVPAIGAFVTVPAFLVALFDEVGWAGIDTDGPFLVLASIAVLDAVVARLTRTRPRCSWVGAWSALAAALLALGAESDAVGAVTAGLGIAAVVLLPAERRVLLMSWAAWLLSGVATVRGALAAGLPDDDVQVALFAWGAAVSGVALALDRRADGDRTRWVVVRDVRWLVPLLAGAGALGFASLRASAVGPGSFGWWSLALGAVVLLWALLADAPALGVVAAAFATDAAARLLPWPLPDRPWNLVVAVTVLSVIAAVVQRVAPPRPTGPQRSEPVGPDEGVVLDLGRSWTWDWSWAFGPFAVANGAAAVVVGLAEETTSPAAAYLAMAAWAFAVAAWTRWWPWALAGAALLNVGAGRAGLGWLTLTLVATSVAATVGAVRAPPPVRGALQLGGASLLAGAWVSAAWWLDVGMAEGARAGAVSGGVVVLAGAVALRGRWIARDWIAAWSAVGVAAVAAAAWITATLESRPAAVGVGVGVLLLSVAAANAARPAGAPPLRDLAALLFAAGGATILVGLDATETEAVAVACGVGFAAVALAALLAYRHAGSPWEVPTIELAVVASGAAVGVGIAHLPDRALLVPALAVAGAYAAVVGVTTRRRLFLAASPLLLLGSWLTFASEALAGNPSWFTMPIGLTLLVVEALTRATLRQRGEDPAPPAIVGVDLVGMAFVVGAALVQTVTDSLWYGVLAVGLGAVLGGWGIVTRVRRRATFGAATVVAAVVLLIGLPLADLRISGAGLWITLAAIGFVAIIVAAFLEQGRRRVRAAIAKLTDLTRDWE